MGMQSIQYFIGDEYGLLANGDTQIFCNDNRNLKEVANNLLKIYGVDGSESILLVDAFTGKGLFEKARA